MFMDDLDGPEEEVIRKMECLLDAATQATLTSSHVEVVFQIHVQQELLFYSSSDFRLAQAGMADILRSCSLAQEGKKSSPKHARDQ